jgi:hypothetical protein
MKSKLTHNTTIAILMNCIMVIFENYPIVSSLTECFLSIATISSKIVQITTLIKITTIDEPTIIPFCKTKL